MTSVEPETKKNYTLGFRDEFLASFEILTLATIFVVIMIGNTIVIYVLYLKRKKFRRMNYFIFALSASDVVTAVFNVLPQLMWDITFRFRGGNVLCKCVKYGQLVGPYLNAYILVVTAIDRYQVICRPLSNCRWRPRHSIRLIMAAVVVSLTFSVPQFFIFSHREKNGIIDCWAGFIQPWGAVAYVTWYAIAVFFIPLVLLIIFSCCICCTLLRHNFQVPKQCNIANKSYTARNSSTRSYLRREVPSHDSSQPIEEVHHAKTIRTLSNYSSRSTLNPNKAPTVGHGLSYKFHRNSRPRGSNTSPISRAKIKTLKLTMIVTFFFIVCSAPFIVVQLWSVWDPNAKDSIFFTGATFTILMLLASLNSVANPWIYLALNESCSLTSRLSCRKWKRRNTASTTLTTAASGSPPSFCRAVAISLEAQELKNFSQAKLKDSDNYSNSL